MEDTFCGPRRKKGERLHHYALRVQSNVREVAKQGVRLPDQVQGFLLLHRADLSTKARIAIMTLASNSMSRGDVRKACKRYADGFLRDPKEHDARGPQNLCVISTRSKCYVRGLCIAMAQYSSLCGCALGLILGGFDIVEADVQDREQVGSGEQEEARERESEEEDKTRTNNERSNM